MSSSWSGIVAADSPASVPVATTSTHSPATAATPTITASLGQGPMAFISIDGDHGKPVDRSADPDHESAYDLEISYQYFLSIKDTEIRSGWVSLVSGALAHRVVRVTKQRQAHIPINESTIFPVADRVAQEEFDHILRRISPALANVVICRAIDLAIPVLLDIREGVPWFKTGPKRPNLSPVFKPSRRGPGVGGYCRFNVGEDMLNLPEAPLSRPAVSRPQGIVVPVTDHNSWTAGVQPDSLVVQATQPVASCFPPAATLAASIAAAHAQTYGWTPLPHQLFNAVGVNRLLFPPPNSYVRPQQSGSLTALPSSPLTPMSSTAPAIPPTPSPAPRPASGPGPEPNPTRRPRSRTLAADAEPSDKPAPKRKPRQRTSTTTSGRKRRVSEGDVTACATSSSSALQGGSTSMPAILEEGPEDDAADNGVDAKPKPNGRQAKKRRTSNVV